MSEADEAHETALHLIREAVEDGSEELSFAGLSNPTLYHLSSLPPEISELENVTGLGFWGIPITDITPLRSLTRLKSLRLFEAPIGDIAPLRFLSALQSLDLTSTQVQDIAPLQDLTALQSLNLAGARVQDIDPLQHLAALQSLDLTSTQVQDIAPLQGLTALQSLDLTSTQVQDIAPLQGLTALQSLDLEDTQVADLRPIRKHENLVEAAKRDPASGLHIKGCTACLNDPGGLGQLAEIEDDQERTRKILDYLNALPGDWTPPGVPATDEQKDPSEDPGQPDTVAAIEAAIEGPILRDSISDVALIESHFEAVSPDPPLPKARGEDYRELVETLAHAARQLADSVPPDQFGPEPPKELRDYADRIERDQPNGRLLDYIMDTIRGFLTDEYLSGALDGVNRTRLQSLLRNHNDFIRAYFPNAGQAEVAEAEVPDTELVDQLPEEVERAIGLIKSGIALDVFGESMLAPVAYLKSRMEAAIRTTVTSAVPENVRAAFVTLRKTATLLTAYVGRAYGRLLEWDERQVKWAKEHPVTTTASFVTIVTGAPKIISSIAPYFAHLWRWIGNLPLPF